MDLYEIIIFFFFDQIIDNLEYIVLKIEEQEDGLVCNVFFRRYDDLSFVFRIYVGKEFF